ncbi:hypothetical protein GGH95_001030 [Coemansia sp. RSA 1836]|nr:hypothetical protein GGH95_001030 [Coemansia sp. RSA 1836]
MSIYHYNSSMNELQYMGTYYVEGSLYEFASNFKAGLPEFIFSSLDTFVFRNNSSEDSQATVSVKALYIGKAYVDVLTGYAIDAVADAPDGYVPLGDNWLEHYIDILNVSRKIPVSSYVCLGAGFH